MVERIVTGSAEKDGKVIQKYVNAKTLIKDVVFEETHDNTMNIEKGASSSSGSNAGNTGGGTTGGGGTNGGSGKTGGGSGDGVLDKD